MIWSHARGAPVLPASASAKKSSFLRKAMALDVPAIFMRYYQRVDGRCDSHFAHSVIAIRGRQAHTRTEVQFSQLAAGRGLGREP